MTPKSALDIMQRLVDQRVHETNGKNRSPVIDMIVREGGGELGAPYCAYSVSHCFRQCANMLGAKFPFSGSSQEIKRAFRSADRYSEDPQDLLGWKGALAGWTNDDGQHGHIFFVKGRLTGANGKVTHLRTLEANTNPRTLGRDGEGFYELKRPVNTIGWYLDTSEIKGGAWWS